MIRNRVSAVILNRNMGEICDNLRSTLNRHGINEVFVVDASTTKKLMSLNPEVVPKGRDVKKNGLRINRGYNLGLSYALRNSESEWVLCLPVDTEIKKIDLDSLLIHLDRFPKIQAIAPIEQNSPYTPLIPNSGIGLTWNVPEGPILLKSQFVRNFEFGNSVQLFDDKNFRGYLSFMELALKIYGNDSALAITNHIEILEREDYLLNFAELMKTEPMELNKTLLISEGKEWILHKYGLHSRWAFENMVRLLYENFLSVNPPLRKISIL